MSRSTTEFHIADPSKMARVFLDLRHLIRTPQTSPHFYILYSSTLVLFWSRAVPKSHFFLENLISFLRHGLSISQVCFFHRQNTSTCRRALIYTLKWYFLILNLWIWGTLCSVVFHMLPWTRHLTLNLGIWGNLCYVVFHILPWTPHLTLNLEPGALFCYVVFHYLP